MQQIQDNRFNLGIRQIIISLRLSKLGVVKGLCVCIAG